MRPVRVLQTGAGSTAPVPLDNKADIFNVGLGVAVTGTVNYTVQHTFEDPYSATFNPATAVWFAHPTLVALTANADGNYAYPCTAVRLTVNSGSGTAALTAIQAGNRG